MKKAVCPSSTRLACRIEANAGLANPDQKTTDPCGERDGRVGDAGTGLQHQTRDASHRDVRAHSVPVYHNERAVEDVKPPFLNEQDGCAILDRNGVGWRYPRRRSHDDQEIRETGKPPP